MVERPHPSYSLRDSSCIHVLSLGLSELKQLQGGNAVVSPEVLKLNAQKACSTDMQVRN